MVGRILQPPQWARPKGYSPGVLVEGKQVFVSGQFGWNDRHEFLAERFCDQVRQALENVLTVAAEAGAGPEHLARLTWYIVDRDDYHAQLRETGEAYRDVVGRHYPAMSMVQVASLLEPAAKVEIEAVAILPPRRTDFADSATKKGGRTTKL